MRNSPTVIIQDLMAHFSISSTSLGFLISTYYYSYVLLQVPGGMIMDRFGLRLVLTLSALASAVGAFLFGLSASFFVAVMGRFFMGAGAACAFVACVKLISLHLPKKWFGYFCGVTNVMGTVGAVLSGYVLVQLVSVIGWQITYYWFAVVNLVFMVALFVLIKKTKSEKVAPLGTHVFFDKNIWLMGITSGLMYVPISVFGELWGTPFLQTFYHIPKIRSAGLVSFIFIGIAVGSLLSSKLVFYWRSYLKVMQIGVFAVAILFSGWSYFALDFLPGIIFMMGIFVSAQVLSFSWLNQYCSKEYLGTGIGFCNTLTMLSGLILQPLFGKVLDYFWVGDLINGVKFYNADAYFYAMLLVPISCLMAGFFLRFIKEAYHR